MEYHIGDEVPQSGRYRCGSCDNIETFEEHDQFTDCSVCQSGDEVSWTLLEETTNLE